MRRNFLICILCSALSMPLFAQETASQAGRLDDNGRIALTPIVLDEDIPAGAQKQLLNKMSQIAAKNGCAATGNSRFIFTCSADILTKDITATAPPMHAYTVALTFYIGDGVEGRLFSSFSMDLQGAGQTPEKAFISAFKGVRTNDPDFKALLDKGKKEIIAYYNTNCDMVIEDAKTMVKRHEYSNAIDVLTSVPSVCEECYRRAQDESLNAYQAWRDEVCDMALNKAQAAWATRDAKAAAEALEYVPTDGACVGKANALKSEIAAKLDAKERQEWEFKMRQYEDQQAERAERAANGEISAVSQQQELQAATNAVAEYTGDNGSAKAAPAKPKYQIKGKWFK